MPKKIIIYIIFTLFFSFIKETKGIAFSPQDNYLWIEYAESIREKDGSVTLPLLINYGRFPGKKGESGELDSVRAFYSLPEKDDEAEPVFYEARIEQSSGRRLVKIKAVQTTRFIVFAQAKKIEGKITHWYLAKTAGTLFGHSSSKQIKPVAAAEINRQGEIFISPQFDYWPQTGNPVRITPVFNDKSMPGKALCLFDENEPALKQNGSGQAREITTDAAGDYDYVPPNDQKLNWQGEQAFKQTIILAEEREGNTK
ncbi:MAG: hypothetical protein V1662_01160, partial [Candidatus Omnitrophota bacterium]